MSTQNLHSADGSFLGFLFQIERVLLWLSEGGEGRKVGIETEDDIVVQLKNGNAIETIYEQAKNAQKKRKPFSDQSEDLWKTLAIWVKAVQDKKIDVNTSVFSAITNKQLPPTRLLSKISDAKKTDKAKITGVIKELKETAAKLSSKNKVFGEVILNCDDSFLEDVIDKITVFDGTYHHDQNEFKKKLKTNLSVSNKLPFDYIYNSLFGEVTTKIIDCWRKGEEAWIEVEAFNNLYNNLIAQYKNKSFLEKATELLPVSKGDIDNNRNRTYVEQLKSINCEEQELFEAIHDYLRSQTEKSRYAREFEITESKFSTYYEDLKQHWASVSRPRFKINPQGLTLEQIGYQVYYETIVYKGKLNNQEPEQSYTYKGAYHHLSNNTQVGWHPEWEKRFKKNEK